MDLYQRDYQKILKNNLNQYNISIFKLDHFYDEIILDKNFNKKIVSISTELIKELVVEIKYEINKVLTLKLENLFSLTKLLKIKL